jgi:pyrophosphatase PpaX
MKLLTAIVSRRRRRVISEELDKFKLRPYIDTIVGREDVTQVKPAPNALTLAAERLAVPIDQCLMVGDSPNDVKAGKAAGAKTAVVLTGPYPVETIVLENPDVMVDSIADLVTVLDRTFDWVTLSDRIE